MDAHHAPAHRPAHPAATSGAPSGAAAARAAGPDPLAGRRVLVTGATGFIGGHLLTRLQRSGADVTAVSRRADLADDRARWRQADLADAEAVDALVEQAQPEVVLHLASRVAGPRTLDLVRPVLRDTLLGTVNLLTAAARTGVGRVVLAGSVEESRRGDPAAPHSPYAAAKTAATGYVRMFHELWDLPTVVLRIAMTYGPAQPDETKLVPYVIRSLLAGQSPEIGSGDRLVDWIHVDDVVAAFLAAVTPPAALGRELDVASGQPTTIRDTVDLIARLVDAQSGGTRPPPRYGARPDRPLDHPQRADPAPTTIALGWRPSVALEDGMASLVSWHRSHGRAPA